VEKDEKLKKADQVSAFNPVRRLQEKIQRFSVSAFQILR